MNAAIVVEPFLTKFLRPHQREGVQFLVECLTGQREFEGDGAILADEMGLGKTLQSITVLWTLLKQGFQKGKPLVRRAIVVCPTSLVANWGKEMVKWLGDRIRLLALRESTREAVLHGISDFVSPRVPYHVLIISYDTFRLVGYSIFFLDFLTFSSCAQCFKHAASLHGAGCCDLIICDEAHRLKNSETATYQELCALPCRKRMMLSGTPLQNDLDEFYSMVSFANPVGALIFLLSIGYLHHAASFHYSLSPSGGAW